MIRIWRAIACPTHRGLESAEEVAEERVLAAERQDLPLDHGALDVVVLQHDVLLERLDGVVRRRLIRGSPQALPHARPQLGQDDLAERPLAQHLQKVEVLHAVLPKWWPAAEEIITCTTVCICFFMDI